VGEDGSSGGEKVLRKGCFAKREKGFTSLSISAWRGELDLYAGGRSSFRGGSINSLIQPGRKEEKNKQENGESPIGGVDQGE